MIAHVRAAKTDEIKTGIIRPLVCLYGDNIAYSFQHYTRKVYNHQSNQFIDFHKKGFLQPSYHYKISDLTNLDITYCGDESHKFNEEEVVETWPTHSRRRLSCGSYTIDVKPLDDTLYFELNGDESDLIRTIMAFYIYSNS